MRNLQFTIQNDAEQAIATHNVTIEFGVLGAAHFLDRAIRQHHPQPSDRALNRSHMVVHAMGIDGNGPAHREHIRRLHGLDGKAGVNGILDIMPART